MATKTRIVRAEVTLTDADFADDIALLASTCEEAERMLNNVARYAALCNLVVKAGPEKTAWMKFGPVPDLVRGISLAGTTVVPRVAQYKYLGRLFVETGDFSEKALSSRIGAAWGSLHKFDYVWKSDIHPCPTRI